MRFAAASGIAPSRPYADFDAHVPIVFRDDHEHAVVDLLAAELPCIEHARRVLLDRLGRRRRHDQHGDLRALALFERGELRFERPRLCGVVSVPVRSVTRACSSGTGLRVLGRAANANRCARDQCARSARHQDPRTSPSALPGRCARFDATASSRERSLRLRFGAVAPAGSATSTAAENAIAK